VRLPQKRDQPLMRAGLGHAVQVDPRIDRMTSLCEPRLFATADWRKRWR
jgi:hypothetical protein